MTQAQQLFDEIATPLCPQQLTAPKLHSVIDNERIRDHIWGAKGVGSQGDGAAQILCKSQSDMRTVCRILESDMDVHCMPLTLDANSSASLG